MYEWTGRPSDEFGFAINDPTMPVLERSVGFSQCATADTIAAHIKDPTDGITDYMGAAPTNVDHDAIVSDEEDGHENGCSIVSLRGRPPFRDWRNDRGLGL